MPEISDVAHFGDAQGFLSLLGTLGLGLFTARNLRRGQQDTHDLDADKQELDRERFEHERQAAVTAEQDRIIETLRTEVARLTQARDADQARHDRDLGRVEARVEAQRATCVQVTRQLHGDLLASAAALRSEVDAAASRDAAQQGETHLRLDHDDETSSSAGSP